MRRSWISLNRLSRIHYRSFAINHRVNVEPITESLSLKGTSRDKVSVSDRGSDHGSDCGSDPLKDQACHNDLVKVNTRLQIGTKVLNKDELYKEIQQPLQQVLNKINSHSFTYPYKFLNHDTRTQLRNFEKFSQNLKRSIKKEIDFDIDKLTICDFINPNETLLPRLICSIYYNVFPTQLLTYYNLQNKQELLSHLITHTFHKFDEVHKIETTKFESSKIDFSNPARWYPEARKMKRKIIMHVGPTNSGKTYQSLQKLANSTSGYYAGPLRLLAREIWSRFNKQGIGCSLITGEEVIPSVDEYGHISQIASGTIEMVPLHKKMDICVIDEIQMIADKDRGSIWTNAVLGVLAHEIHLCGEESAVPLIEKLVKVTGDELSVKRFERLGKLTVEKKAVDLKSLKKGDCLVSFSKRKILEYKSKLEKETKLKVGIVYGALPPEIRSQEAEKFNNGEYDVLVASDAIGMGLNLKINRVVFSTCNKFNGNEMENLSISQVKQIAGRAGRYSGQKGASEGFVTALNRATLVFVKEALQEPIIPLEKACVWPTMIIWKHYMASHSTNISLSKTLENFYKNNFNLQSDKYFIADSESRLVILDLISGDKKLSKMTIDDQFTLSDAPISFRGSRNEELTTPVTKAFFENIVERKSKTLFDFDFLKDESIIKVLTSKPIMGSFHQPMQNVEILEALHKLVLLYMWLSQRFPTLFIGGQSSLEMKLLVERRLSEELIVMRRMNMLHKKRYS
ncbi:SUV3 [Candida oxycetoniae]|uniref:ATP-dependent RNA helicase SUV3, mitochondrial n=1 Tax=Candida oxycetoniae TaxID=497107 RepID=A0AAI9SV39_9ASCO|nr:SUV3 [Candida oxycetoniae]KAI3403636.2 SUV3 [Candida oxycetoniae]